MSAANQSYMDSINTKSLKESVLIGGGVLALSFAGGNLMKDNLGVNLTTKGSLKLVAAIVASNFIVDYAKTKNWVSL